MVTVSEKSAVFEFLAPQLIVVASQTIRHIYGKIKQGQNCSFEITNMVVLHFASICIELVLYLPCVNLVFLVLHFDHVLPIEIFTRIAKK